MNNIGNRRVQEARITDLRTNRRKVETYIPLLLWGILEIFRIWRQVSMCLAEHIGSNYTRTSRDAIQCCRRQIKN